MTNFIGFHFSDNDFHQPLREAVEFIAANRIGELSHAAWQEFVLRGMVAFNSIRRIDEWSLKNGSDWNYKDYRGYFEKTLKVLPVQKINDLPPNFEGYVYDTNLNKVFYHGY